MNLEETLRNEAEFADRVYTRHKDDLAIAPQMFRLYSHPRDMWDLRQAGARLLGELKGKHLLDMGCGMGEETAYFAKLGADVTAVDISPIGIELTRKRADFNGLGAKVKVYNMLANQTTFPDHSFDIVHGLGILHHIGLEDGIRETKRLLKPGGKAVFLEHIGDSAFIERLKPLLYGKEKYQADYTDSETPLRFTEIHRALAPFRVHQVVPYYLMHRLRGRWPFFQRDLVRKADYCALRICPPLKHFVGAALIYFEV